MNNKIKYYGICWAVLFIVFNVVVFVVKPIIPSVTYSFDTRFWIAWAFVVVSFIGQLICAITALKAENIEKLFLNIPIIKTSYTALILSLVFGIVLLIIPDCPWWIAVIVSVVILGFSIIAVVKAKAAANLVSKTDTKVKEKTFFIKSLRADAESLMARGKTEEIKEELRKVYEAVRYSDPMTNDALSGIESEITIKFNKLASAVNAGDGDAITELAEEAIILINDRNNKCRLLK